MSAYAIDRPLAWLDRAGAAMSAREWNPGDVAMVTLRKKSAASIDGQTVHVAMRDRVDSWASGTTFARQIDDADVKDARPLVVIDPEDREAVERLAALYERDDDPGSIATRDMQAALREFANPTPPRPDEPLGLGAVVEDVNHTRWTRVESGEAETRNPWYPAHDPRLQPAEWSDIAAVRVLSEGVTP